MVDLMNLLSDVLIGSFQMLMLNDLGKNMFPYRIKTCWTRILIYGVTALVILGVNHIESTFINIMMVPVSYTKRPADTKFLLRHYYVLFMEGLWRNGEIKVKFF